MDGLSFYKLLRVYNERYAEATLNDIRVSLDSLYLILYKDGKLSVLRYSAGTPALLLEVKEALGESAGALAPLSGSMLKLFKSRGYDRVGYARIQKRKPSGRVNTYTLVFEPTGNHANAFLLNEDGMIQYRLTAKNIDPDRDIGVGKIYQPPKQNKELSLTKPKESEEFLDFLGFYKVTAEVAATLARRYGFAEARTRIMEALDEGEDFYKTPAGVVVPFNNADGDLERIPFEDLPAFFLTNPQGG